MAEPLVTVTDRDTMPGRRLDGYTAPTRGHLVMGVGLAASGGVALAAAFPPYGLAGGALLGPALLVIALRNQSWRASALMGAVFGTSFQGVLLFWLAQSIGPAAWIVVLALEAAWFATLGLLVRFTDSLPWPPLWFAVSWVAVETLRSSFPFGGFPWGRLGFLVLDTPWAATLPYLAVTGAGFLVAVTAALLGGAVDPRTRDRRLFLEAGALVVVAAFVPLAWPYEATPTGTIRVAVVQGGVPGDGRHLVDHHREVTGNHARATTELASRVAAGEAVRPELMIWPENAAAVDPIRDQLARTTVQGAVEAIGVPVLVGGMVDGPSSGHVLNQGVVWTPTGPTSTRYTKHHPVPFGEYVPFRGLLGNLSSRFEEIPRDMLAGTARSPLDVAGVSIADAICFDVAYDEVLSDQVQRGARLVVVQTSNATFTGTAQLDQQFAMTRARALESQRAVAVASTNGVTALIAPDGQVEERAPVRTTSVLVGQLPLTDQVTPASRLGTRLSWAAVGVALLGVVVSFYRSRVRRVALLATTGR